MYTLTTYPTQANPIRRRPAIAFLFLACLALTACNLGWETEIVGPEASSFVVNAATLKAMETYIEEEEGQKGVPLERVLWDAGHPVIDQLVLVGPDGTRVTQDWPASADDHVEWLRNGQLVQNERGGRFERIEVVPHALYRQVQAGIVDLAPTAAAALGLPAPAQAVGKALDVPPADHVLLLFLDGFGYVRYTQALEEGDIPALAELDAPLPALTTYPPITCVSTGSLLTGAPPSVHGADRNGARKTETETIFDVATVAGRSVVAVEGEALAFQLRGAEWQLSGDRDGNGSTDDNVLRNALAVLAQGMPNLLFVHFHGIDDAGHTYGPGTLEERAAVRKVDAAAGRILAALPKGTLVLLFADHGMHPVQASGRLGNHGHLIAEDMLIPIFVWFK
jgi:hypothetical protein